MKRGRGTALGAVTLEALARFRRTVLAEAAAHSAARPSPPPPAPIDGPAAFRLAVADVIPLPPPNRANLPRQRPKAIARHARNEKPVMADSLSDPWEMDAAVSANEELAFVRSGVPTATLKKMRRGGWAIRGELDLHGHTGDEARVALPPSSTAAILKTGAACASSTAKAMVQKTACQSSKTRCATGSCNAKTSSRSARRPPTMAAPAPSSFC